MLSMVWFIPVVAFLAVCPFYLTPHMVAASFAYVILAFGFSLRRSNNRLHQKLMLLGMAIDTFLVLALQFERSAIQTAMSFTLAPLQQMHVGTSSVAFFLYFPILFLGWKSKTGSASANQRKWHKRLGLLAFTFRTIGFLFMFSLLGHHIGSN